MERQIKKISDLIEFLKQIKIEHGDKEIIVSSDFEGNSFARFDNGIETFEIYGVNQIPFKAKVKAKDEDE